MTIAGADPWTVQVFQAIDARRADDFAAFFAEDGVFRFGNSEPVHGRQGVEQAVAGFFGMIGGLSHRLTGVWTGTWEQGEVKSVEAEVTYTRADGSQTAPLPVTSTLRLTDGKIQDYRIYIDVSPVFTSAG